MLERLRSLFSRWFNTAPSTTAATPTQSFSSPESKPDLVTREGKVPGDSSLGAAFAAQSASTTPSEAPTSQHDPVLVHKEVLDQQREVIGYDFSLREDLLAGAHTGLRPVKDFLSRMLVDQLAALDTSLLRQRTAFLQLPERSILRLGIGKLPRRASVLVTATNTEAPASTDSREVFEALRQSGREIWLDDCLGTPWFASLADIATGAIIRLAPRHPEETAALVQSCRAQYGGLRYAAWDVATAEDFEMARGLACERFSGPFLTRRENWQGNEMSPRTVQVAQLINNVRAEADMRTIADVLKQDMALSYRLLRYVNNAADGLSRPISSIEQGLLLLGQNQLDRWLTLLLLSAATPGNTALTEVALARARFLELVGAARYPAAQCDELFVLGLFSMLDLTLKVPLETALQPLNLSASMKRALLFREGPLGLYLALADASERGEAGKIIQCAVAVGLTTTKVSARQIEALEWVAKVTGPAHEA